MPTIRDVAKTAGVAVGTVSRVLNDRPNVDPILRERVERAIKTLGYRVNSWGRSLARDTSPCISFVLGNRNVLHPVHSRILQGVEEECDSAEYFVVYAKFQYRPETKPPELRLPRVLRTHGIADCATWPVRITTISLRLLKGNKPLTFCSPTISSGKASRRGRSSSLGRFYRADLATDYLIQLGHRDIWYIGDVSLPWSEFRTRVICKQWPTRLGTP